MGIFTMLLVLTRTALNLAKQLVEYLATFSGGLGQQIILIFVVSCVLPVVLDFIEQHVLGAIVWLLDKFR